MKRVLLLVVLAALVLPGLALADTVWVVTESAVNAGKSAPANESKSSKAEYAFRPETPDIVVVVAGRKCALHSSVRGSVPMGCNYTVTIAADGSLSGELRAGNAVCTQTPEIVVGKACK